jgi:hypothetical protein
MQRMSGRGRWLVRVLVGVVAALLVAGTVFVFPRLSQAAGASWLTYHDPEYGFTVRFPAGWLAMPEADGTHVSFVDPHSTAVISPIVQVIAQAPARVLAQAPTVGAVGVTHPTVAGLPAIEFALPYIARSLPANQQGGQAQERGRELVVAQPNTAGTTNAFMLVLSQSANEPMQAVDAVFDGMVASFAPPIASAPVQVAPGQAQPASSPAGMRPCSIVCWADAHWNVGAYWDTYTVPEGSFQPNFGCTPFVSRALTTAGLTPGLLNGGVGGSEGLSPDWGPMAYGEYPIRFGTSTHTTRYDLVWTGTRGSTGPKPAIDGLYEYLVDTGIGVPIGENVWEASPGDVIFLDRTDSPGPDYREHAMIITALMYDGWTGHGAYPTHGYEALLDGHNAAAYHDRQASWTEPYFGFPSFEIIHIRGRRHDAYTTPTVNYAGNWYHGIDWGAVPMLHTSTTNVWNKTTRWAIFRPTDTTVGCGIDLYVPAHDATAHPMFIEVRTADGRWHWSFIYETNMGAWVYLYAGGDINSAPTEVAIANADGSTWNSLGIGSYLYLYC